MNLEDIVKLVASKAGIPVQQVRAQAGRLVQSAVESLARNEVHLAGSLGTLTVQPDTSLPAHYYPVLTTDDGSTGIFETDVFWGTVAHATLKETVSLPPLGDFTIHDGVYTFTPTLYLKYLVDKNRSLQAYSIEENIEDAAEQTQNIQPAHDEQLEEEMVSVLEQQALLGSRTSRQSLIQTHALLVSAIIFFLLVLGTILFTQRIPLPVLLQKKAVVHAPPVENQEKHQRTNSGLLSPADATMQEKHRDVIGSMQAYVRDISSGVTEYTTTGKDTLWDISRAHYAGNGFYWVFIYALNTNIIRNPDILTTGLRIAVPRLSADVVAKNNEAIPAPVRKGLASSYYEIYSIYHAINEFEQAKWMLYLSEKFDRSFYETKKQDVSPVLQEFIERSRKVEGR